VPTPRLSYLVAAGARSGSTLLNDDWVRRYTTTRDD
jgi:hypothetical protein